MKNKWTLGSLLLVAVFTVSLFASYNTLNYFSSPGTGDDNALIIGGTMTVMSTATVNFTAAPTFNGGIAVNGTTTSDGVVINAALATAVVIDTGTVVTVTDAWMVMEATGTAQVIKPFDAAPIFSTSTHTNGTEVTIVCTEGSIVLDDNTNQALGGDITLGATDTITLYLNGATWYRKCSADN